MSPNTAASRALLVLLLASCGCAAAEKGSSGSVTIALDAPVNTFTPANLGGGIDGHRLGDEERILSPANVKEMLSVGVQPISYRLRTELAVDAWHWNPHGTWSDPARKQGYWTSCATSAGPIRLCYGYRLPRRGSTEDQANNDGYSRLDDGDPNTFWKSNPYLDEQFTGEKNASHPQWVTIDFDKIREVNAIRIHWATPWATRFTVEYGGNADGWHPFLHGAVTAGKAGESLLRLGKESTQYVRIVMTDSSNTAPPGSTDIRDGLGYAIREIEAGLVDTKGDFRDWIIHRPDKHQSEISVSSTDPWHRESDRDDGVEQPGFDMLMDTGLANGLPMLAPVAVVYDTPENAAAEVAFLKARGYDVPRIEMGEECDGQQMSPFDYAALYLQWATAIHKVAPAEQLGGPCFETIDFNKNAPGWKIGNGWWIRRFLDYLAARGRSGDFNFFSFEWYPFDDVCAPSAPQLPQGPGMLRNAFQLVGENGINPRRIPVIMSEFGYSAFSGQAEVDMPGALLNADITGLFLTLGGETAYLYGYEPSDLRDEYGCSWGDLTLFLQDAKGNIRARVAAYWGARMLTHEWVQPGGGRHEVYRADGDIKTSGGEDLVTSYAVRRPDRRWAFLLINKDPAASHEVALRFQRASKGARSEPAAGPCDVYQFSPAQYVWHAKEAEGYPSPSDPPVHTVSPAEAGLRFQLPPYSITVVRTAATSDLRTR